MQTVFHSICPNNAGSICQPLSTVHQSQMQNRAKKCSEVMNICFCAMLHSASCHHHCLYSNGHVRLASYCSLHRITCHCYSCGCGFPSSHSYLFLSDSLSVHFASQSVSQFSSHSVSSLSLESHYPEYVLQWTKFYKQKVHCILWQILDDPGSPKLLMGTILRGVNFLLQVIFLVM
jgi:hypothetical protein